MASVMLHIAENLTLPLEAVTQSIGILAKRRAGKSYLGRKLAEQFIKAGQQIVIVDPKGDWWGIRSSADGKSAGLPVVIIGGERGDVKLEPSAGEVVAKLAVEERVSVLLDLSLLRKHEIATFMTAFLETLYRLKAREAFRTPLMLIIDEADAIAPQKPQENEARMLGAAEDIVRRGGQRGIGCTMITQRSAVLNKNVLTQVELLIALRTIAPQDLAAMNAWIDVHGTDEERKILMASLPSLPIGDAWFWSPGWPTADGIFKRARVHQIETFDSGATPRPGEKRAEPKTVADIDLGALRRQMAETIERAKADDPKELRRQIVALKAESQKKHAPQIDPAAIERAANDAAHKRDAEWEARLRSFRAMLLEKLESFVDEIMGVLHPGEFKMERPKMPSVALPPSRPVVRANRATQPTANLPSGEQKVLTACAQYPNGLFREQLTVLTAFKRSTRDAYIQRLGEKGFVAIQQGKVFATESGVGALGDFEPLPSGVELQAYWLGKLPEGEARILQLLIESYPEAADREYLSEATGYARSSRDAYLQRMSAKELVENVGRGQVRASKELF